MLGGGLGLQQSFDVLGTLGGGVFGCSLVGGELLNLGMLLGRQRDLRVARLGQLRLVLGQRVDLRLALCGTVLGGGLGLQQCLDLVLLQSGQRRQPREVGRLLRQLGLMHCKCCLGRIQLPFARRGKIQRSLPCILRCLVLIGRNLQFNLTLLVFLQQGSRLRRQLQHLRVFQQQFCADLVQFSYRSVVLPLPLQRLYFQRIAAPQHFTVRR